MRTITILVAFCIVLLMVFSAAMAEPYEFANPLIDPMNIKEYIALPHPTVNILLLGIDFGHPGYWGSGGKKILEDCHTDAVMVIAVNLEEKKVDFVSLPRDTLTYVPGVKGIYKLNAAINCGSSIEDGLQKACDAASWVLGGIKIDYYLAVDMNAMAKLGDAIGGVDFELEMSYTGHSGKKYHKGPHHLDGIGITDYMRARTNATVNANDIGRTGRQRELMIAILEKLKNDKELLLTAFQSAKGMQNSFFTNIADASATDFLPLVPIFLKMDNQNTGTYVITGKYRTALNGWNFTFTDQRNRKEVIRKVYGVDVPELKYVSIPYTKWLVDHGFSIVRYLAVAEKLLGEAGALDARTLNPEQRKAIAALTAAYEKAEKAFQIAADSMTGNDTEAMVYAGRELRRCGDAVHQLIDGLPKPIWVGGQYWYADRLINEADVNFR